MTVPKSPHDKLFTEAFGTSQAARGLLQALLPESILARIDLSSVTPAPGEFVDEVLAGSQSDLLFCVELAGRPAFIYVLLEHKSYQDPWVALQLLRYMVRIWEKVLRDRPAPERLPPVIPLVVYHGGSAWKASTRLADIIDPVLNDLPEAARFNPSFEFLVDDLSQATDDQVLARSMGLLAGIAAIFLRDARRKERVLPMLRRMVDLLRELWQEPDGRRAVAILLRYLWSVAEADQTQAIEIVKLAHPEAEELIMTIAEQLRQEGEQRGMEQGMHQGRLETLRQQLEWQFGPLNTTTLARLEAADGDELERFTKRILTAASLDDVFAD